MGARGGLAEQSQARGTDIGRSAAQGAAYMGGAVAGVGMASHFAALDRCAYRSLAGCLALVVGVFLSIAAYEAQRVADDAAESAFEQALHEVWKGLRESQVVGEYVDDVPKNPDIGRIA